MRRTEGRLHNFSSNTFDAILATSATKKGIPTKASDIKTRVAGHSFIRDQEKHSKIFSQSVIYGQAIGARTFRRNHSRQQSSSSSSSQGAGAPMICYISSSIFRRREAAAAAVTSSSFVPWTFCDVWEFYISNFFFVVRIFDAVLFLDFD